MIVLCGCKPAPAPQPPRIALIEVTPQAVLVQGQHVLAIEQGRLARGASNELGMNALVDALLLANDPEPMILVDAAAPSSALSNLLWVAQSAQLADGSDGSGPRRSQRKRERSHQRRRQALGLESDDEGKNRNYLSWSVLGLLMSERQLR